MQLRPTLARLAGLLALLACGAAGVARADDTIELRGQYYKERTTTVIQPTLDVELDLGPRATIGGHLVLDSISAASVAAGQQARFTERRYEGGLRGLYRIGEQFTVSLGGRVSSEPDYVSRNVNAALAVELWDKNATFAVSSALSFDDISDAAVPGSQLRESLRTHYFGLSWTQLLGPRALAQVGYDLFVADGYQANPYRQVVAAGVPLAETVPQLRLRNAAYVSARVFEPRSQVVAQLGYRYYFDDWGVSGHTPEVSLTRDLGRDLELRLRYRFYTQRAADFYREIYDRQERFLTDDAKLAPFDGHTLGARATLRLGFLGGALARFREGELSALYERVGQNNRFGTAHVVAVGMMLPY